MFEQVQAKDGASTTAGEFDQVAKIHCCYAQLHAGEACFDGLWLWESLRPFCIACGATGLEAECGTGWCSQVVRKDERAVGIVEAANRVVCLMV